MELQGTVYNIFLCYWITLKEQIYFSYMNQEFFVPIYITDHIMLLNMRMILFIDLRSFASGFLLDYST